MTRRLIGLFLGTTMALPMSAFAQETLWLQIEARRTLQGAAEAARGYASRLENVAGFSVGNGYYGIALGPYEAEDARRLLNELLARGQIPPDSYTVSGADFEQQFYPVGVGAPLEAQPLPDAVADAAQDNVLTPDDITASAAAAIENADVPTEPVIETPPEPEPVPDETRSEALQSEALLGPDEKRQLQIALQWAGYYNSTIDGLFGRGTRGSMAGWQADKGYEATGVLTTRQRNELLSDYNAVLEGMELARVRDDATGIEIVIPTGPVAFAEYQPPFAKFEPRSDALPAQVLLISQPGDEDRFFGFYEILQSLALVPPEGERSRSSRAFEIDAIGPELHTYVYATREDGAIKGFMLIWPTGDEERRSRILAEMRSSFTRIDGVLDPAIAPPDEDQGVNLVAGLEIRQPRETMSGFYIDNAGSVLTSAEIATGCTELTIEGSYDASVAHMDADLGIAVLRPAERLAPIRVAEFQTSVPRLRAEVAVAGYPFGGLLSSPALTFGTLEDIRGLAGEEEVKRLSLQVEDGDAGGPLFDNGGAVLGMLLPRDDSGTRVLPKDVNFAADAEAIIASLRGVGITVQTTPSIAAITPELLTLRAAEMTVLVSCW
ncbi:serine protease [Roseisalinus antarcticus]|uniref:Putative peptidoglycan binding domain protein n=1 Tax=Roseisalinus antarcticus TaxID=254357 RepID=A0A1Y5TKY6_9RHOB|nr:serine protease [Roseisalinus antarcticus]SLN66516.1 Putative peptidoglycan binding domain protein [Roseisalinus antarcticus]